MCYSPHQYQLQLSFFELRLLVLGTSEIRVCPSRFCIVFIDIRNDRSLYFCCSALLHFLKFRRYKYHHIDLSVYIFFVWYCKSPAQTTLIQLLNCIICTLLSFSDFNINSQQTWASAPFRMIPTLFCCANIVKSESTNLAFFVFCFDSPHLRHCVFFWFRFSTSHKPF